MANRELRYEKSKSGRISAVVMKKSGTPLGKTIVDTERVLPVHAFHAGMENYAPTPLRDLSALAEKLGVERFWVKDESARFGLNAFKALGGSYAIANVLCRQLGIPMGEETYRLLRTQDIAEQIRNMTFVTATDGNHGRGVAWTAMMLGCKAVVYLPKGSAQERLQNILKLGAHAEIMPWNYDDTVRYAARMAQENGWTLVQDTSWEGYEDIPAAIMQGYTTLTWEITQQLRDEAVPTHIFLQAGVGSMAGAAAGYLASYWKENCPRIIVVEPDRADCLYQTAKADDGALHAVTGELDSMMAGLCCGEPCPIAWDILKDLACAYISCEDTYSASGMRMLGKPMPGDPLIVSGESGAVTAGVAAALLENTELAELREALGLNEHSRILVISTEGDTDCENYRKILSEA